MGEDENLDELEEGEEDEGKPKEKKKLTLSPAIVKILTTVLLIVVVALVAGFVAVFVSTSVSKTGAVAAGITDDMVKSEPPNYYSLGEFSQTTSDLDAPRFVRVTLNLTYTENPKGLLAELPERYLILRDRVADIISTYPYDVVRTVDGKNRLKEDIRREINNQLKNGQIDEVLFDNFIVN